MDGVKSLHQLAAVSDDKCMQLLKRVAAGELDINGLDSELGHGTIALCLC